MTDESAMVLALTIPTCIGLIIIAWAFFVDPRLAGRLRPYGIRREPCPRGGMPGSVRADPKPICPYFPADSPRGPGS